MSGRLGFWELIALDISDDPDGLTIHLGKPSAGLFKYPNFGQCSVGELMRYIVDFLMFT